MPIKFIGIDEEIADDGFVTENLRLYYTIYFGDETFIIKHYSKSMVIGRGYVDITKDRKFYAYYEPFKFYELELYRII